MRVGEFVYEARLTHPGFAHDRRYLAMTLLGSGLHALELLDFGAAADKAR